MTIIHLRSFEGDVFDMDIEEAKKSLTLRTMLEDLGKEDDGEIIALPRISSKTFRIVVDWSKHHVNDPDLDEDSDDEMAASWHVPRRSDNIDPWDKELMKPLETADLFEVIMAANYLNIKGLLATASKTVANLIKGKTPEQIREVFNIRMVYRKEEESKENEDEESSDNEESKDKRKNQEAVAKEEKEDKKNKGDEAELKKKNGDEENKDDQAEAKNEDEDNVGIEVE